MRLGPRTCLVILFLATSACGATAARAAAVSDTTRVTFVAGGSIYVNAGAAQGLAMGDTLEVLRAGQRAGLLVVTATSQQRAVCVGLAGFLPSLGDRVRGPLGVRAAAANPAKPPPPTTSPAAPADSGAARAVDTGRVGARTGRWLRGSAGTRWLAASSFGTQLQQPMLDLRVNGRREHGPLDVALDLRAHRTTLTSLGPPQQEVLGRLYRGSIGSHALGTGFTWVAGRQVGAGTVSLFDGLTTGWNTPRWGVTAYGGTEPEPTRMRFSADILQTGTYLEVRQVPSARGVWNARLGAAASFDHGNENREFAFLQGFWRRDRVSIYGQQEMDVAPSWRRATGAPAVSATNSFATVNVGATPWLDLNGGYDARRDVRLWRDRETPETEFDDRAREGGWVGATVGPRVVRVSGEVRTVAGGGQNDLSWNGGLAWSPKVTWAPAVRGRYASYRTDLTRSQLTSFTLSLDPPMGLHLEGSGGRRVYDDGISGVSGVNWYEGEFEWSPGARWFLHGAWTVEEADPERMIETLGGMSWRF